MAYQPARQGTYYNPKLGRIVEHHGYATRIHWNTTMLDYLRRHFPTKTNQDLADWLGVSPRTVVRKARELGLQKDTTWLHGEWDKRRRLAHLVSSTRGNSGQFRRGEHANPASEFKRGHQLSPEAKQRQAEGMRQWYRRHPVEVKDKAAKAWTTRRRNMEQQNQSTASV